MPTASPAVHLPVGELFQGTEPQGQPCLDKLPVRKASRCPLHTITLVDILQWLSGTKSESGILLAGESNIRGPCPNELIKRVYSAAPVAGLMFL